MEWEKEESKERIEESGYDVERSAPPGVDHADPLQPDMSLAARGPHHWSCKNPWVNILLFVLAKTYCRKCWEE